MATTKTRKELRGTIEVETMHLTDDVIEILLTVDNFNQDEVFEYEHYLDNRIKSGKVLIPY